MATPTKGLFRMPSNGWGEIFPPFVGDRELNNFKIYSERLSIQAIQFFNTLRGNTSKGIFNF
jgi:hypothetical protein